MKTTMILLCLIWGGLVWTQEDFAQDKSAVGAENNFSAVYRQFLENNPFIDSTGQFVYDADYLLNMAEIGGGSTVGNGGDVIYCQSRAGKGQFEGYYALDYLLTYVKSNNNSDIVEIRSWEESRDRILSQLQEKAPLLAEQFEKFLTGMNNVVDYSADIIWQEASFGLLDLKDEQIMRALPTNCYHENHPQLIQMIRRVQQSDSFTIFEYNPELYNLFKYVRPLQFSMMMLHEFAWSFTADVNNVRQFVRMVHSKQLEKYDTESFDRVLNNLNFKSLRQDVVTVGEYNERLVGDAKLGNYDLVKKWIFAGADVNVSSGEGHWTALMHAAKLADLKMTKLLLQYGAMLNTRNDDGDTALLIAAKNNHTEVVEYLLNAGAEINVQNDRRETALLFAAGRANLYLVKLLLTDGAEVNVETTDYSSAILRAANNLYDRDCNDDSTEIVRLLLQAGANPDLGKTRHLTSALAVAVDASITYKNTQSVQVIKLLLQAGALPANAWYIPYNAFPVLHYATANRRVEIVKLLLDAGADPNARPEKLIDYDGDRDTPLIEAAKDGSDEIIKMLLDAGAKINEQGDDNFTALIVAIARDHIGTVKLLLDNGANADIFIDNSEKRNSGDRLKFTALIYAARYGKKEIVKILLEAGANPNEIGEEYCYRVSRRHNLRAAWYRYTALFYATQNVDVEMSKDLIDAGADVNFAEDGYSSLLWVIDQVWDGGENVIEMVKILLKSGADVNFKGNDGMTPLIEAVKRGNVEMVKLLLKAGADKRIKDDDGHKAYYYTRNFSAKLRRELRRLLS